MRLIRFRVTVNQELTVVFSTTVGGERGAKGAAVSGNRRAGILDIYERTAGSGCCSWRM